MKTWFRSSVLDDDGTLLKALLLLSLLIIVLILLFGPPTYPVAAYQVTSMSAMHGIFMSPNIMPLVKIAPKPKVLYITEKPHNPPVMESTPVPIPPGGGILHKIAFTSNRSDGRHYQLYIMDANGFNLERLHESNSFDRDPHFSYDGTRLAFCSNRTGVYQIYIMDLATRAVTQITKSGEDKTNPFWSPNNQQIMYTLHKGRATELGMVSADASKSWVLPNLKGQNRGYGFSPNGSWISFESSTSNRNQIFIYDILDKKAALLMENDELTFQEDPVFSPAGHQMVFISNCLDRNVRQLYIYDLDWKKHYRISNDDMDKDDPIFSPDGTKIAYIAKWENAWNIFIVDADGKHARNITKSYYDHMVPSWR